MQESNFICTPKNHIKLGEICCDDNGEPALLIKRSGKNEYEKVPVTWFTDIFPQLLYNSLKYNTNRSK